MRTIPDNHHLKFNERLTWVPLFEITIGSVVYYYTPNTEPLFVDGNQYDQFPIMLQELQELSTGEIPTIKLVTSNIGGIFSSTLKQSGSIDGESVTYKIAVIPHIWEASTAYSLGDKVFNDGHIYECTVAGTSGSAEPTWDEIAGATTTDNSVTWTEDIAATDNIIFEETLEILKVTATNETISFDVGAFNPYLIKFLQEKYLKNFCWNVYKGEGCWIRQPDGTYSAPSGFYDLGRCNKTLTDCISNSNTARINSFVTLQTAGGRFA